MFLQLILWMSTMFGFLGYYFINRKNITGYKLFIIGNILTILFDIITKNYAQMIMFVVFIYFNIDGIKKWSLNIHENKNIKI